MARTLTATCKTRLIINRLTPPRVLRPAAAGFKLRRWLPITLVREQGRGRTGMRQLSI